MKLYLTLQLKITQVVNWCFILFFYILESWKGFNPLPNWHVYLKNEINSELTDKKNLRTIKGLGTLKRQVFE